MTQTHTTTATNGLAGNTIQGYGVNELLADVNLANNGYLFCPTQRMVAVAQLNPEMFTYSGGLISKKGTHIERGPELPKAPRVLAVDGPDYEALILDRQAADGLYD